MDSRRARRYRGVVELVDAAMQVFSGVVLQGFRACLARAWKTRGRGWWCGGGRRKVVVADADGDRQGGGAARDPTHGNGGEDMDVVGCTAGQDGGRTKIDADERKLRGSSEECPEASSCR